MCNHGVDAAIHYLDDYLMVRDPHSWECAQALQHTLALCEQLGVPVSKAKVQGAVHGSRFSWHPVGHNQIGAATSRRKADTTEPDD